jgi:hypothetical protein
VSGVGAVLGVVSGVAGVDGVVSGVVSGVVLGAVPDDPPDPSLSGQFALVPVWLRGVPVPGTVGVDSVPALGAADGSGLAAETMAAPPPTRIRPATAAASTVRRRSPALGAVGVGSAGGGCAGSSGRTGVSIGISFDAAAVVAAIDPDARSRA